MTFLVTIDAAASCHPEPSRFSVILNAAAFVILNVADFCHPERSRRRSEGSGAPHLFSTLTVTGDSIGDMRPDDAVESVYQGSAAHISTFLWRYAPR